jgi:hypothetical protein
VIFAFLNFLFLIYSVIIRRNFFSLELMTDISVNDILWCTCGGSFFPSDPFLLVFSLTTNQTTENCGSYSSCLY